jgi:hypothetical protein
MYIPLFSKRYAKSSSANLPLLNTKNNDFKNSDLDEDIKKIIRLLPKNYDQNCRAAFWIDTVCQTFAYIVGYTMIGKEIRVVVDKNKDDEDKIRRFNKRINIHNDTIEDYIIDIWIDNLISRKSAYRIAKNITGFDNEPSEFIDIQRVSPETLEEVTEPANGWRAFIQSIEHATLYKNKEEFLNQESTKAAYDFTKLVIPDDPRVISFCSLFRKAPMESVTPYVILKYWILTFMRKFSEKMWAPFITALVGNEKNWPNGPLEMASALDDVTTRLSQLKNFSSASFPGNVKIDVHEPKTNGELYIKFFDKMNAEIMFGLFSSIAARESVGVYKGNELADESTVRFLEGIRNKIANTLKRLYIYNITPNLKEEDITIIFPELRSSTMENMIHAFEVGLNAGIFKDAKEKRLVYSQIIPLIGQTEISDAEIDKLDKEFITLNAPSQPGKTTVEAAKGGKPKPKSSAEK